MAVPAHDERDYAFARAVRPADPAGRRGAGRRGSRPGGRGVPRPLGRRAARQQRRRTAGCSADEGGKAIVGALEAQGKGRAAVTYRLRDWLISRQRYWGTPIPVIYCPTDGIVPVPDEDLPVRLPDTVDYRGSGENPLARDEAFLNVDVPAVRRTRPARDGHDGHVHRLVVVLVPLPVAGEGRRRRSTRELVDQWTPVDQYTGGAEHAVMHLLYAREWTKMMRDVGLVDQDEPFRRLFNQGQILGLDGERMSKSRGNTVDPDDLVARYGADTVRLFLMFMGPWDQGGPWSPTGIGGVHRFLNRLWTIALDPARSRAGRSGQRLACRPGSPPPTPASRSARPPIGPCAASPPTTRRSTSTR